MQSCAAGETGAQRGRETASRSTTLAGGTMHALFVCWNRLAAASQAHPPGASAAPVNRAGSYARSHQARSPRARAKALRHCHHLAIRQRGGAPAWQTQPRRKGRWGGTDGQGAAAAVLRAGRQAGRDSFQATRRDSKVHESWARGQGKRHNHGCTMGLRPPRICKQRRPLGTKSGGGQRLMYTKGWDH